MHRYRTKEQGATALIIVMFSVLMFITITVSFMKIMAQEQMRTNDNELSQGAYDSALAGVEDGKRVLAMCQAGVVAACNLLDAETPICNIVSEAGLAVADNNEVYLKTTAGANGRDFEQAYTCVKIRRDTDDYRGSLAKDGSTVVPLTVASDQSFDQVHIYWFAKDLSNPSKLPTPQNAVSPIFSSVSDWNGLSTTKPPVLRVQLMQFSSNGFKPEDFDSNGNAHTLYLYPTRNPAGFSTTSFSLDGRRAGTLAPVLTRCNTTYSFNGYACQMTIALPDAVDMAGDKTKRRAYLRLMSIYNETEFRVVLEKSSGEIVKFHGVQPSIDSTGRAADVFRRVEAKVEFVDPNEGLLYPRATVDITNNFCKSFVIGIVPADYSAGTCSPTGP